MNAQEIFDKVVLHLWQQREQSLSPDGHCAYRGEQGRKCAIGCLIPDEEYDSGMESLNLTGVFMHYPKFEENHPELVQHSVLLSRLQEIHDKAFVHTWEEKLKKLAKQFSLIFTLPTE